jgi:Family of unknown function (DUF6365)
MPMTISSGEALTASEMAGRIAARGDSVRVLASAFLRKLLPAGFASDVGELSDEDGAANQALWESTIDRWRPEVIVFADYPLLFFRSGVVPLANLGQWAQSLDALDASLVTLDHLGYAQRPVELFFGPPHLSLQAESLPSTPRTMRILLPCPLNQPIPPSGRLGIPFRWLTAPPRLEPEQRAETRRRYLGTKSECLVFHSVPTWALRFAHAYGLPYYQFLPEILDQYLDCLPKPVTVISVNDGELLPQPCHARTRFINLSPLPAPEYEELLLSADLMICENAVSMTLARAVAGLIPSVAFRNSFRLPNLLMTTHGPLRDLLLAMERASMGSVFPFEVFPIWSRHEVELLGLFFANAVRRCFLHLEIFGGERTRQMLRLLLTDTNIRRCLRRRQESYMQCLQTLPDSYEALHVICDADSARR